MDDRRPRYGFPGIRKAIVLHLTDFCWQTSYEILTVVEQLGDDIFPNAIAADLFRMFQRKEIERRRIRRNPATAKTHRGQQTIFEYKLPARKGHKQMPG